jgi:hypothetical protein
VKFVATKKGMPTNFFSPLSFVAVLGSGIRDPGSGMSKNQDPGSGINIPDPQHCLNYGSGSARANKLQFWILSEHFRLLK